MTPSFAGGGLRAATLPRGVLQELRGLRITFDCVARPAPDEGDMITGVPGGSFAALAYVLYGDRLFNCYGGHLLKRDIQGLLRTPSPAVLAACGTRATSGRWKTARSALICASPKWHPYFKPNSVNSPFRRS